LDFMKEAGIDEESVNLTFYRDARGLHVDAWGKGIESRVPLH
jgi:hypothetical protein